MLIIIGLLLLLAYIMSEAFFSEPKIKNKPYGIIYKIENKINHKVYIGQTTQKTVWHRYNCVNDHSKIVYNTHNYQLKKDMIRYGIQNFEITNAIDTAYSKNELNRKEKQWISYYNSNKKGYNKTKGGN